MKNFIFLIGIALLIAGCAVNYSKHGFTGGYDETQLQEDIFKVTFRGNKYTSNQRIENFGLLRCAEVTLENGYNYFIIIKEETKYKKSTPTINFEIQCFREKPKNIFDTIYDAGQVKTNIKNKYKLQ